MENQEKDMKRKSFFWLALIVLSMLSTSVFAQFAGGSGTENDPWQIATADHLNNLRNYLGSVHHDKFFIQTADIDLGVPPYSEGEGWEPIGQEDWQTHFQGNYDGAGHKISGLYIDRPDENFQALFGVMRGSVRDLELEDVNVTGGTNVGALVGEADGAGGISGCHSSGYVEGYSTVGGLVGLANYSQIIDCHSSATVMGQLHTGGLLGGIEGGKLLNCYSSSTVWGMENTGGLIGTVLNDADISHCHSSGEVTGEYKTGGFAGEFDYKIIDEEFQIYATLCHSSAEVYGVTSTGGFAGSSAFPMDFCHSTGAVNGQIKTGGFVGENLVSISNCFSTGSVYGMQDTGGFVGWNQGLTKECYSQGEVWGEENTGGLAGRTSGFIRDCYSAANVDGNDNTGGLAGKNEAFILTSYSYGGVFGEIPTTGGLVGKNQPNNTQILSSYWDMEASAQSSSDGGQGRLTAQMVFPHSDDSYVAWDWEIWAPDAEHSINGGYPYLRAFHTDSGIDDPVPSIPENMISAFPQPAFKAPRVSIKSESPGKLSYAIYNVRGQKVYSAEILGFEKEQSFELPLEAWKRLSNGVYLLSLERDKHRIATSRMVVVK